jgi:hypothetical protein
VAQPAARDQDADAASTRLTGIPGCPNIPTGKGTQITPICTSMLHQNPIPVDTQNGGSGAAR